MAETNLNKNQVEILLLSSKVSGVEANGAEEKVVNISVVEGVVNGDYPSSDFQTSKRAWEYFVQAGIEPGELIAQGLHEGHDYPITRYSRKHLFTKRPNNRLTGETLASQTALVSYYFKKYSKEEEHNLIDRTVPNNAIVSCIQILDKPLVEKDVIESTIILAGNRVGIIETDENRLLQNPYLQAISILAEDDKNSN